MFLLLEYIIGDLKTNEWLTCFIDDHISNFKKRMEDYFPTSEPSPGWMQETFIAEMNNEQLNFHKQHLELQFSSRKEQVQILLTAGILVQCFARISWIGSSRRINFISKEILLWHRRGQGNPGSHAIHK